MLNLGKVIAHRGASAKFPENTLKAFDKALESKVLSIEFDVMLSQDGQAFVFHDETLNRTTNARGKFAAKNAEYIKTLDAGSWFSKKFRGEPVPTLEETLEWLIKNKMQANIEIKPAKGYEEETAQTVLKLLNLKWPINLDLPLVSSFKLEVLQLVRALSPEMPLALVFEKLPKNWLQLAEDLTCYSIHLNHKKIKKHQIVEIKDAGYKVFAYTVDSKRRAKKLFSLGIDAIFSNYPDLLAKE